VSAVIHVEAEAEGKKVLLCHTVWFVGN
jgi:hypothetical protein